MEKIRKHKKNPVINILTMTVGGSKYIYIIRIGKTVIKDWEIKNNMLYLSPGGALLAAISNNGIESRCNYILNIKNSEITIHSISGFLDLINGEQLGF